MNVDYNNAEHYPDPTAFEAIKNAGRERKPLHPKFYPMVYICSPYSGDVERNVENARRFSRYAVEKGYIPITPHLLFPQFLDDNDPDERAHGLLFGTILMDKCKEIWVFGEYISAGMKAEIDRAVQKRYALRYFTSDCVEVQTEKKQTIKI